MSNCTAVGSALLLLGIGFLPWSDAQGQAQPPSAELANLGFECGSPGEAPPGWIAMGDAGASGYRTVVDRDGPRSGKASARLEAVGKGAYAAFGALSRAIDAAPYRGKRIRVRAAVRVRDEPGSKVGLWLRVDRPGGKTGFFDNMADRPIRNASWTEHAIEGTVSEDAERIFFGLLLAGPGAAWIDDVRVETIGSDGSVAPVPAAALGYCPPAPRQEALRARFAPEPAPRRASGEGDEPARALTETGLSNLKAFARLYGYIRFFHPSDEAASADWDRLAIAGVQAVEAAEGPKALAAALNAAFKPIAPTFDAYVAGKAPPPPPFLMSRPPSAASAIQWRHTGIGEDMGGIYKSAREEVPEIGAERVVSIDLPGGVSARIPIGVWRTAGGKTLPSGTAPLAPKKPAGFVPAAFDRATRLAAAVSAWSVLRHFYPYADVVELDWQAELDRALKGAATDRDPAEFHRTLRKLVAALDDGHGGVGYEQERRGTLPLDWEEVEGRLVVTAAGEGADGIRRGDVVTHIGGVTASEAIAAASSLVSGSAQWARWRGAKELLAGPKGERIELRLAGSSGEARSFTLVYPPAGAAQAVREAKPEPVAELRPGILYVDIDRASDEQMRAAEPRMAAAKALIFDLRGYPKGTTWYLPRLTDRPIKSARMEIAVHLKPERPPEGYVGDGWNIPPRAPRFTDNVVFITNASAISYSESILGTVKGNRLAEIVGEPSAGANGNVTSFKLPGAYRIAWTGMRVSNRDGTPHHVVGVRPTIPASRTIAGVRAGRDELLEKALEVVGARLAGGPS